MIINTISPEKATVKSLAGVNGKKMTVSWNKLSYVTGYELIYSTNSSFKSGNKTITLSKPTLVSTTITGLTKGRNYYVRVRAYKMVGKTKLYGTWSEKKKVMIKN